MKKKVLLLILLGGIISFSLLTIYLNRDFLKPIQIKIATYDKNKLIFKLGGLSAVEEMYKNSKSFCLRDSECMVQATWCCDEAVNSYHYKKFINMGGSHCMALCSMTEGVICNNNACELIEKSY